VRAVCNTSPLVLLAKIHRLDLLHQLYDEVIIPSAVLKELGAKPAEEAKQVWALLRDKKLHLHND
jgi:predicted nucleic acid-binding protein